MNNSEHARETHRVPRYIIPPDCPGTSVVDSDKLLARTVHETMCGSGGASAASQYIQYESFERNKIHYL